MERNMKMNAPFGRLRVLKILRLERDVEVAVTLDRTFAAALDNLVQIGVFLKCLESLADLGRRSDFQRRAEMNFADLDLFLFESPHHIRRLFKFDRQMASIVVHA